MKQRGRKSAAELATVSVLPLRTPEPPVDFMADESRVWARICATKPADWWDAGSLPLLAQFCRAAAQADTIAALVASVGKSMLSDPDELARYKELRKIQAGLSGELTSLGRSMRLTQQARYNAKNSDTANRKANGKKPWQIDVIEG